MKVFYDLAPSEGKSAVALGNFDGLHIGHRKVISLTVSGKERGLIPTVLTFASNPLKSLGGEPGGKIITREQKIRLLEMMGIQQLYILDFSSIRDLTAEEFVDRILAGICKAGEACCGFNFTFGRGGRAGGDELQRLCAEKGMRAFVAPAVLYGGAPVSSTRIRGLISNGRVEEAAELLDRPFCFFSPVLHGRHLGHRLGTPTINQAIPKDFIQPEFGVYASLVHLQNGSTCYGVTNVGVKPTVGSDAVLSETWMPDYRGGDLYGCSVQVDLLKYLRPERKFPSLEELKRQIALDGIHAREYLLKLQEHRPN